MAVTIHVDFSNGVITTLATVPLPPDDHSVTGALDAAGDVPPGLDYEFEVEFVDRGAREVGRIQSIAGVAGHGDQAWSIWVNDRPVSGDLRRVVEASTTNFGLPEVVDDDVIACKLLKRMD